MGQRVRLKKNRNSVKGYAVKKRSTSTNYNDNQNTSPYKNKSNIKKKVMRKAKRKGK